MILSVENVNKKFLKPSLQKQHLLSSITKYDDVIEAVGDNMKTDMTFKEMKSFISYLSNGVPRIDSLTLEGYDDMSTGIYYYKLDEESLRRNTTYLQSHLGSFQIDQMCLKHLQMN